MLSASKMKLSSSSRLWKLTKPCAAVFIVFVNIIRISVQFFGMRRHKMTPLILIHLNQLYAVNLQPTLHLPVKHSCVMTACAAWNTMAACPRESRERERERDVPVKPSPIFYLWPTGSPSVCPLDDTQEVSTTHSHQNTSRPDQSLTVKWGVVSGGRLLLVVEFIWSPLVSCLCFHFPPSLTHFSSLFFSLS